MKKMAILLIVMAGLMMQLASATIPAKINYQGRLTDKTGNPVVDGNYSVTFSIYDVASGGSHLWRDVNDVTTKNGYFNTALGAGGIDLSSLAFDLQYYLGIKVEGESNEMSPRIILKSVPYAMRAKNASPLAQSGAIDISPHQGNRIYFYLDNSPRKVLLFIKGEKCNPLFYSELGAHNHGHSFHHSHSVTLGSHDHGIDHDNHGPWVATSSTTPHSTDNPGLIISTDLGAKSTSTDWPGNSDHTGLQQSGISLHGGTAYEFLNNTTFNIDGVDKTNSLEALLGWSEIGDGTSTHPFVTTGSSFIDITSLDTWSLGQHFIGFDCSVGGRINYTLYIYY